MKRILDIRFIFILVVLVVAMACQQTADPAAPPVATAEPQPTETLTAQETPAAVVATSIDAASSLPPCHSNTLAGVSGSLPASPRR